VGQGEVGRGGTGQEQHEGGRDEGDGVLLLPGLQAGGDERQIWKRITGEARTRPPKTAILTRSESPSRGEVT
jgi:hypothetical protein